MVQVLPFWAPTGHQGWSSEIETTLDDLWRPSMVDFRSSFIDLPNALQNFNLHLYADDSAVTVAARRPDMLESKLNLALATISNWFQNNMLSLNYKKSKVMYFGT